MYLWWKVTETSIPLNLFHGPTLPLKDVGGRFYGTLLGYFIKKGKKKGQMYWLRPRVIREVPFTNNFPRCGRYSCLCALSKGKVSEIQENSSLRWDRISPLSEVDGTFDDCQALVKATFMDKGTEQNICVDQPTPSMWRVPAAGILLFLCLCTQPVGSGREKPANAVICVSGSFGNITAGFVRQTYGTADKAAIASNNRNGIFYQYLQTQLFIRRDPASPRLPMPWMWSIEMAVLSRPLAVAIQLSLPR